jgi:uncharacterized protein
MSDEPVEVKHEEKGPGDRGSFYIEREGRRIGEMGYVRKGAALADIKHTEVDPAFGGRGYARALLDAGVRWARDTGTKLEATCPYAAAQFRKDASIQDVLA